MERYMYRVTEITPGLAGNCEVGTILATKDHYPPEDEPLRTWEFASMTTGEPTGYITAEYLGPYDEVAPVLQAEAEAEAEAEEEGEGA